MIVTSVIIDVNSGLLTFIDQERGLSSQHSVDVSKFTIRELNGLIFSEASLNGHQFAANWEVKVSITYGFDGRGVLVNTYYNPDKDKYPFGLPITTTRSYGLFDHDINFPLYDMSNFLIDKASDAYDYISSELEPEPEHRGNSENEKSPFGYLFDGLLNILFPAAYAAEVGGYELRAIYYDPLVLDLNHNGVIDTANIENGAYFDGGNDDFSEKMGWVSGGDGLLCIDKNNDKLIDSSELFGNSDVYGFDMLKSYDDNNDGVIDSSDSIYSSLSIWVDNGNGITEEGELRCE